jgi:hypothetical protein
MRKSGSSGQPEHHVVQPDTREDRDAVPPSLAVVGDQIATVREWLTEQLRERVVAELRFLYAENVGLPLIQPRE